MSVQLWRLFPLNSLLLCTLQNNFSFLLSHRPPCIDTVDCHSFLFRTDLTHLGGVQISLYFGSVPASRPPADFPPPAPHTQHQKRAPPQGCILVIALRAGIIIQVSCIFTCQSWTTWGIQSFWERLLRFHMTDAPCPQLTDTLCICRFDSLFIHLLRHI